MSFKSRKSIASPIRFVLLAAAFAWGAALADTDGDTDLGVTVTAMPTSVTLGTAALPTYASYNVSLKLLEDDETLNTISFSASTAVFDAQNNPLSNQATFPNAPSGWTCTGVGTTSLSCTSPSPALSATNSPLVVSLTVSAPSAGDHVTFTITQASYVEADGSSGCLPYVVGCPPPSIGSSVALANTALTAPNPLVVSSYVPPAGATVYTGTNGGLPAPGPTSTWAALAVVPPNGGTTASIVNLIGVPGCPQNPRLLDCSNSTISIPGTFTGLVFDLRRDASTITKKADISSAIIYYDNPSYHNPLVSSYDGYAFQVPACTDTTYGALPAKGIPCIYSRTAVYSAKPGNDTNPNGKDDTQFKRLLYWEFVIHALDNGRFTN